MCDGSVQPLDYDIGMIEFELLANRHDGGDPDRPPAGGPIR
jgi:hypothetical protein